MTRELPLMPEPDGSDPELRAMERAQAVLDAGGDCLDAELGELVRNMDFVLDHAVPYATQLGHPLDVAAVASLWAQTQDLRDQVAGLDVEQRDLVCEALRHGIGVVTALFAQRGGLL